MGMTPEKLTQRFKDLGLPATLPDSQRAAWFDYVAGKTVSVRLLPKNGARCAETTMGGMTCGRELLIDGTCYAWNEHRRAPDVQPEALVPVGRLRELAQRFDEEAARSDGGAADAYGDAALRLNELLDELGAS